jgi:hypothetical protein
MGKLKLLKIKPSFKNLIRIFKKYSPLILYGSLLLIQYFRVQCMIINKLQFKIIIKTKIHHVFL